jgi:hypothetical protein
MKSLEVTLSIKHQVTASRRFIIKTFCFCSAKLTASRRFDFYQELCMPGIASGDFLRRASRLKSPPAI